MSKRKSLSKTAKNADWGGFTMEGVNDTIMITRTPSLLIGSMPDHPPKARKKRKS
jgi:hypothetical protein